MAKKPPKKHESERHHPPKRGRIALTRERAIHLIRQYAKSGTCKGMPEGALRAVIDDPEHGIYLDSANVVVVWEEGAFYLKGTVPELQKHIDKEAESK